MSLEQYIKDLLAQEDPIDDEDMDDLDDDLDLSTPYPDRFGEDDTREGLDDDLEPEVTDEELEAEEQEYFPVIRNDDPDYPEIDEPVEDPYTEQDQEEPTLDLEKLYPTMKGMRKRKEW